MEREPSSARPVIIEDSVPTWLIAWLVVLGLTCVIGWIVWSVPEDESLRQRPRQADLKLQDAVEVLRYGGVTRSEPQDWHSVVPVDGRVHVEIRSYAVIDDLVGYGGEIVVAAGEGRAVVDLERIFAGRHVLEYWTDGHDQLTREHLLRLASGRYPIVVTVPGRHNWHGADLNPYKRPESFDRRRFVH